jgi:NTP pyrophosphatase (non-canonical NTP hydrolase)
MTYESYYDFEEFKQDVYAFNEIAGKDKSASLEDLAQQFNLIAEEVNEIADGLENNNPEEVLDGVVDTLVVVLGMAQKLEALGFDVQKALHKTCVNNFSKFPEAEDAAIETVQMYHNKGVKVSVEYNSEYEMFVIKDENGKVRKPVYYVSNDLVDCIPEDFKEFK